MNNHLLLIFGLVKLLFPKGSNFLWLKYFFFFSFLEIYRIVSQKQLPDGGGGAGVGASDGPGKGGVIDIKTTVAENTGAKKNCCAN